MRGEYYSVLIPLCQQIGSSLRARGILWISQCLEPLHRIIPACAGNTRERFWITRLKKDHPCVRGEYVQKVDEDKRLVGSSLRARGILSIQLTNIIEIGIIPACAGNTRPNISLTRSNEDHPCVRGEYQLGTQNFATFQGSSLRARGIHFCTLPTLRVNRIIPACAGNTSTKKAKNTLKKDHPCVRGEYAAAWQLLRF